MEIFRVQIDVNINVNNVESRILLDSTRFDK